jgi:hypothetical protein
MSEWGMMQSSNSSGLSGHNVAHWTDCRRRFAFFLPSIDTCLHHTSGLPSLPLVATTCRRPLSGIAEEANEPKHNPTCSWLFSLTRLRCGQMDCSACRLDSNEGARFELP